jgi:hypothetical protein
MIVHSIAFPLRPKPNRLNLRSGRWRFALLFFITVARFCPKVSWLLQWPQVIKESIKISKIVDNAFF